MGIALAVFIVAKIFYWISSGILKRLTRKTKTEIDDLLIDAIDEPLVIVITVFGLRFAASTLAMSDGVREFVASAMQAAVMLAILGEIEVAGQGIARIQPAVCSNGQGVGTNGPSLLLGGIVAEQGLLAGNGERLEPGKGKIGCRCQRHDPLGRPAGRLA